MRGGLSIFVSALLLTQISLPASVSEDFVERHEERLAGLVSDLDPEHPEMQRVAHLWQIGNKAEAMSKLLGYYEAKSFPLEILGALDFPDDLEVHARAALGDSFFLLSEWEKVPRREDGGIDWRNRGERGDKERAWMLNRHGFLPDLAEAYERTGDVQYKEQLNALWQDWILNNPYPDRLTFSPPWRALEVARRILNAWVHVFYGYEIIEDETRLLILSSVPDHGDALREHASFWGGNHLITEKLALLTLAAAWPELAEAEAWKDHAIDVVTTELEGQTYPDGSYKELSNHYQRVVLVNAQYFLSLLSLIDPDWRALPIFGHIEQMWDFFAYIMRPDGSGPLSNASDREHNAAFVREVWDFYDRQDWLYLASGGKRGIQPTTASSTLFLWAGQAVLRNSWNRQADWIYFDAGPYGSGHQHIDRLHLSASIRGKSFLVDSGRYTYQPGYWYNYFKGPNGHNTLSLDDKASVQGPRTIEEPMDIRFSTSREMSFVAAMSRFEGRVMPGGLPDMSVSIPWSRAVLLDHRGFTVVVDHVVAFGPHDLEARWHFHPDVSETEAAAGMRLVSPSGLFENSLLKGIESPRVAGFYSPEYNLREPAYESRTSGSINRPTTLVWILQSPGDKPLQAEVLSRPGSPDLHLRVNSEGTEYMEARIRLYPEPELMEYRRP